MALRLTTHGGFCCGIHHINGFNLVDYPTTSKEPGYRSYSYQTIPDDYLSSKNYITAARTGPAYDAYQAIDFITAETTLERLDRYLDYVKKSYRIYGIVEIVLAKRSNGEGHQAAWFPHILERGFKEVSNCYNSNSGNRIYVFHLVLDNKPVAKPKPKAKKAAIDPFGDGTAAPATTPTPAWNPCTCSVCVADRLQVANRLQR